MASSNVSRSQEISGLLRDEILRGQYRPGERLPSERDLVARFETSRGTVREAFKKLEQLGVVSIQPGGARVVPVEDCTLDVLGPLLNVGDVPDQNLIDQTLQIGSVMIVFAVEEAMRKDASAAVTGARAIVREMLDADGDEIQSVRGPARLTRYFAESSGHLVLRLIMNGLHRQVVERLQVTAFPPRHDPLALRRIAEQLDAALVAHDCERIAQAMKELMSLIRDSLERRYSHPKLELETTTS